MASRRRGQAGGQSERIETAWLHEFFTARRGEEDDVVLDASAVSRWLSGAAGRRRETSEP